MEYSSSASCQNKIVGRILIAVGALCLLAGLLVMVLERAGIRLGRLPGDIVVHGKNSTFYFPLVTCILLSLLLTLLGWLFGRR
jgi:hypothetical protein